MKEKFTSLLIVILWLAGIADYGIGLVHSFKKHGTVDGVVGFIAFPWAIYRGVECLWHDDYKDVNWDKRLESDLRSCIYFLESSSNKDANQFQLNEDLETFSLKLKDYPKEKKQFLMDGSRKYTQYGVSLSNDLINSIDKYYSTGNFNIAISEKTIKIENELKAFKLDEDIKLARKGFTELNAQFQDKFQHDSISENFGEARTVYTNTLKLLLEKQTTFFKKTFKNIFDEDL